VKVSFLKFFDVIFIFSAGLKCICNLSMHLMNNQLSSGIIAVAVAYKMQREREILWLLCSSYSLTNDKTVSVEEVKFNNLCI